MVDLRLPNFMQALVLGLLGGVGFVVLAFLTSFVADLSREFSGIVVPLVLLVILLSVSTRALQGFSLTRFVVLLAGISIVGSLIAFIIPGFNIFLPTGDAFSVDSLLLIFTSIAVGQFIGSKIGL